MSSGLTEPLNLVNDVHREAAMSVQEQQRTQSEKEVDLHDYGHPHRLASTPLSKLSHFSHRSLTDGPIVLNGYMDEHLDNGNEARSVRQRT